jgi:hypothetical protein
MRHLLLQFLPLQLWLLLRLHCFSYCGGGTAASAVASVSASPAAPPDVPSYAPLAFAVVAVAATPAASVVAPACLPALVFSRLHPKCACKASEIMSIDQHVGVLSVVANTAVTHLSMYCNALCLEQR